MHIWNKSTHKYNWNSNIFGSFEADNEVLKLRYYQQASFGAFCTEKFNFKPGSCSFHEDLFYPNHFLIYCKWTTWHKNGSLKIGNMTKQQPDN